MAIGVTWLIMVFIAKDIMVALKEKLKIQVVAMKPICALMGLESLVGRGKEARRAAPTMNWL